MDVIDDLKSIRKQNSGADCRGNPVHKAIPNTRSDFDVLLMKTRMWVKWTMMVIWNLEVTDLIV